MSIVAMMRDWVDGHARVLSSASMAPKNELHAVAVVVVARSQIRCSCPVVEGGPAALGKYPAALGPGVEVVVGYFM